MPKPIPVKAPEHLHAFKTSDGELFDNLQKANRREARIALSEFVFNALTRHENDADRVVDFMIENAGPLAGILGEIREDRDE